MLTSIVCCLRDMFSICNTKYFLLDYKDEKSLRVSTNLCQISFWLCQILYQISIKLQNKCDVYILMKFQYIKRDNIKKC